MPTPSSRHSSVVQTALFAGLLLSVVLLAWLGLRVSREWQQSATLLVERRAEEAVSLFSMAVSRDMRAVQSDVLAALAWQQSGAATPRDVTMLVASAFARYPYPEFFFAVDDRRAGSPWTVFLRENRLPAWEEQGAAAARFPVRVVPAPAALAPVRQRLDADAAAGRSWSVFQTDLDGRPHQVIARLQYADALARERVSAYGFAVDLAWVRAHYFPDLTAQMQRMAGADTGLDLAIVDDTGAAIASTRALPFGGEVSERPLPLLFMDARMILLTPPSGLPDVRWKLLASASADTALVSAIAGARWTSVVAAAAAVMLALGLALSARALRASARLAVMRAEFMTSITHELKTPIASIRALAQNLATGRVAAGTQQREYGQIIDGEARRLSRLVDNVLAHARMSDVAEVYTFEPVRVEELFAEAAERMSHQLRQAGIALERQTAGDLPPLLADAGAMALVIDNLLDNAIRYSGKARAIRLRAEPAPCGVRLVVADDGIGISAEEIPRIVQKGVRGKNAPDGGSGLGLAIVTRIVDDHGGRVTITSTVGVGTTVSIDLPAARVDGVPRPGPGSPTARGATR